MDASLVETLEELIWENESSRAAVIIAVSIAMTYAVKVYQARNEVLSMARMLHEARLMPEKPNFFNAEKLLKKYHSEPGKGDREYFYA